MIPEQCLTRQQWATCAAFLSASCGRPIASETLEAYYAMLNDIPASVLQVACKRAIQSEETTWLPSVGLIRRFAAEAVHGVLPSAMVAYQQLDAAFDGCWSDAEHDAAQDTLPDFTLRVYEAIGRRSVEALFIKTYETMARQEVESRKLSPYLRPTITGNRDGTQRITTSPPRNERPPLLT